jgi:shikimate kinase
MGAAFAFGATLNPPSRDIVMNTLITEPPASISTNSPLTLKTHRVVLTGFMGAGKSTVGRLLSSRLGWQFVDVDAEVERQSGLTIAEIFESVGEVHFRRKESSAIARALGQKNTVIALGGGAPEILTNRLLLEQTMDTTVIFLDAPFEVLFDRCVLQEGAAVRPVLMDAQAAAARFRARAPHYLRCSTHRVATTAQQPGDTVEEIVNLLSR